MGIHYCTDSVLNTTFGSYCKMRGLTLCLVVLMTASCVLAQQGGGRRRKQNTIEVPNANLGEVQEQFSTRKGAEDFVECILDKSKCVDRRSRAMSRVAPFIVRARGDCKKLPRRIKCDPQDAKNINYVIKKLEADYPNLYKRISRHLLTQ